MSDAHRVIIGPITRKDAGRQRIKYGPLTMAQFNDLERVDLLGVAQLVDLTGARRNSESVSRAMLRLERRGWVESSVNCESWRLTDRGSMVLGFAYDHLDTIAMNLEGDEDA